MSDFDSPIDLLNRSRDGSLIKRKQQQWARERASNTSESWFPFGRPGAGAPNTPKHSSLKNGPAPSSSRWSSVENVAPQIQLLNLSTPLSPILHQHSLPLTQLQNPSVPHSIPSSNLTLSTPHCPPSSYYGLPMFPQCYCNQNTVDSVSQRPPIFAYSPHGNGSCTTVSPEHLHGYVQSIPYQCQPTNEAPESMLIGPSSPNYTEQWTNQLNNWKSQSVDQQQRQSHKMAIVNSIVEIPSPSTHSPQEPSSDFRESTPAVCVSDFHPALSDGQRFVTNSRRGSTDINAELHEKLMKQHETQLEYAEQIAEKQRLEMEQLEMDKKDKTKAERIRRRIEETLAEEAEAENNRWRQRQHELAKQEQMMTEALTKAEKEAKLVRKARLLNHALDAYDSKSDIRRILIDGENEQDFERARQTVQMERNRRKDMDMKTAMDTPQAARKSNVSKSKSLASSSDFQDDRSITQLDHSIDVGKITETPLCRRSRGQISMKSPKMETELNGNDGRRVGSLEGMKEEINEENQQNRNDEDENNKGVNSDVEKSRRLSFETNKGRETNPWGQEFGGLNPLLHPLPTRSRRSRPSFEVPTGIGSDSYTPVEPRHSLPSKLLTNEGERRKESPVVNRFNHLSPMYSSLHIRRTGDGERHKLLARLSAMRIQLKLSQRQLDHSFSQSKSPDTSSKFDDNDMVHV